MTNITNTEAIERLRANYPDACYEQLREAVNVAIEALKQPEIIYCKDCKHWKDSDGVYRRGFDVESKCPINIRQVYEGTFYCSYAERITDAELDWRIK